MAVFHRKHAISEDFRRFQKTLQIVASITDPERKRKRIKMKSSNPLQVMSRAAVFIVPSLFWISTAAADVTFTDANFNDFGSYTQTFGPIVNETITPSQCPSCGSPGAALQIVFSVGDTTSSTATGSLGLINSAFSYDPGTQGTVQSINASIFKDLSLTPAPAVATYDFNYTFIPLIEQDGNFYLSVIAGPVLSSPNTTTGFNTISASGLTSADFNELSFVTGALTSNHPNFSGDTMSFGLASAITNVSGGPAFGLTSVSQNLSIELVTTPEPSMLLLLAGLLPVVAVLRRRHRRG
jgi:hypothetical protein